MINQIQREKLYTGFGLFLSEFRSYVISFLQERAKDEWIKEFERTLGKDQKRNWEKELRKGKNPEDLIDYHHFQSFAEEHKDLLKRDFPGKNQSLPTWLLEIASVRHKLAHHNGIEEDEAAMVWIRLRTIAKFLGKDKLLMELSNLKNAKNEGTLPVSEAEKIESVGQSHKTETQTANQTFVSENPNTKETSLSSLARTIKPPASQKSPELSELAKIDDPVVAINIAKQYPYVRNAEDLYNSTRGLWRLSKDRAEKAKYAFAVYKRIIREVYEIDKWVSWDVHTSEFWVQKLKSQGTEIDPKINEGRYQFIGELASDVIRKKYIGRELPEAHAQNPIRYFNC